MKLKAKRNKFKKKSSIDLNFNFLKKLIERTLIIR